MARNQSLLVNWSQYLALRTVATAMQCFGVQENLRTAGGVGALFHRFNHKRRQRAETNIARSFPHWSSRQVRDVARRSMEHMFQLFMVDSLVTPRLISPASWNRYVRLGSLEGVLERLIRRQPTIFITGHCGNWELLGFTLAALGYPISALARPLDNPLIDRWLLGIRQARGLRVITKWGATPILQESLLSGGQLGFIADQNAGDGGLFVPFFGRLASSYKSIGLLAMRYNVPIIAGHARRLDSSFRYELSAIDCITPEDWADQPDPLFYITARYNRAIEQMIRLAPEQYLWLHRRWKSRPRHEREGRPVPNRLIARLESLPWMTQEELDRIIHHSEESARCDSGARH
ncbi:MAG: lysophospholipid acyltransferase family protein [Phycisphaerales bacterium]|nr:MAG: lysophospholipid acyltransferase family protein [Phycisphaerales bacterium]